MLFKYREGLILTVLFGLCACHDAEAEGEEKFRIEGGALVHGVRTEQWTPLAHVQLDGQEHVGFVSARRVNYIKTSEVLQLPYPVQMTCTGHHSYFTKRDTWGWSDFFMNPMVLMMVPPVLIILLLPKLINMNDPGMRREMEQSMNMLNPSPEIPDVSELMTKFFAPPKCQSKSTHRGHRGSGPRRR
ncbi:ER membrane protein complex subunit 7-like isoform X2 [Tachysurus fulvidraco]|uniref:ER membrane protein complex subunit 7-like isoform X2 n=1 Tax=Tachysurus fulvidraco TaxID=1234273 RepID=UPI001FEEB67D|nr:ER membrane protein complex subunit 7-like isoform X2 [Tachysurus fulvidraco]